MPNQALDETLNEIVLAWQAVLLNFDHPAKIAGEIELTNPADL